MNHKFKNVYFVGIGGIGMSAIARYFKHIGCNVMGYDKTQTVITDALVKLGISVHFDDNISSIDDIYLNKEDTLVVYTPAIPNSHLGLRYFVDNGYNVVKRSKMLGTLSEGKFLMAVAGTHGKTSTSTMLSHFNYIATKGGGSAFLGGISKNHNSNLLLGSGDRLTVEADEFDRSFLQLFPDIAIVTSTDADHLDIYDNHDELKKTFTQFVEQIKPNGVLIYKKGIELNITNSKIKTYSYSLDQDSDFRAKDITSCGDGTYRFNIKCPDRVIQNCRLGAIGLINVENAVAAVAAVWAAGSFDEQLLKEAMDSFMGVKRRLELYINTPEIVYMDDYAHHPTELESAIRSLIDIYPERKILGIFQPHLYTRTRDFVDGFARSLSMCDEVVLLPIYPAREEPIEGVNSELIFDKLTVPACIIEKENLIDFISDKNLDVVVSFGAGNIDTLCQPINNMLHKKYNLS